MVSNKILQATFLNPTGGEEAIQVAFRILNKEPFNKENILPSVVIDSTNVRIMELQMDKIEGQQNDIEKQQGLLLEQKRIYHTQGTLLNSVIAALVLALALGSIAFFSLRHIREINRRLAAKNDEILLQKNQLMEMTETAKEATDAKLNFFTNISHEFRTPLTLILAPLEEVLSSPKLHFTIKNSLELVHRNSIRLLRLINQLMDFRKIEGRQMRLIATENDIAAFVNETASAFKDLAHRKSISFNIINNIGNQNAWFDVNMLDKVIFNLLSNAFKFTNEHGDITVTIDKDPSGEMASIKVRDTGIGMTHEEAEHAFELFYQGDKSAAKGTGLGLSLSKELIRLHHGDITISSERWKGACFEIRLPLGKSHLEPGELFSDRQSPLPTYEDVKIYTTDITPVPLRQEAAATTAKDYSILIIEDNDDLRAFLKQRLEGAYEVHEAENGAKGLSLAYDIVPDLLMTDIILPSVDGLRITETLKKDIRTSHIPIILLTAKSSIQEQIVGIKSRADVIITKPFNLEYLEETIKGLLNNRALLRDHFTSELPTGSRSNSSTKIDRKFINEFNAIVENNLSNEKFSVDDLCREIGISRVQMYRKVKALIGFNVNDYILAVRLQKAKFLLINEDAPISEIAFKVGFSSQAYFSTVFKSKFAITPSEYREKKKTGK